MNTIDAIMNNSFIFIVIFACVGLPLMICFFNFIGKKAKSDSLIDAARESEDKPIYHSWMSRYSDPYGNPDPYATGVIESVPPINCIPKTPHPDHPDYMRMVVHQMD